MICGIGIDSVEIHRFDAWHTYHEQQLLRIFSHEEIMYCLQVKVKSSERFAARFAAKEAFFKSLTAAVPSHSIPFLTLCKNISVGKNNQVPFLRVEWVHIISIAKMCMPHYVMHLSLTHTKTTATAMVIFEL